MKRRLLLQASAGATIALALFSGCKDKPSDAPAAIASETHQAPPSLVSNAAPPATEPPAETAVASATPSAVASAVPSSTTSASPKKTTGNDKPGASAKPEATAAPSASAKLDVPAAGSADEVAQHLDDLFVPKKTWSAKFKQEYVANVANQTKTSSGSVMVEKPNKISFRYDAPNKNRIVSDGSLLKIYIADDQQMMQSPVAKTEYPGALSFLMGHGLRPSFAFRFNDKVKYDKGPVLYGKPRDATPYYDYVQFWVDKSLLDAKDPNAITKVLIVDAQGNKNRFEFESASVPDSIDKTEFQFTPPAGTDIKTNQ